MPLIPEEDEMCITITTESNQGGSQAFTFDDIRAGTSGPTIVKTNSRSSKMSRSSYLKALLKIALRQVCVLQSKMIILEIPLWRTMIALPWPKLRGHLDPSIGLKISYWIQKSRAGLVFLIPRVGYGRKHSSNHFSNRRGG